MIPVRRVLSAARDRRLAAALGYRLRQLKYLRLANGAAVNFKHRINSFITPVIFSIDVVGSCNLRCPTCPVANWPPSSWTGAKGFMEPDLLERIIRKALGESFIGRINLFAYTEPLLHPRLHDLVKVVKSHNLLCCISTNLNRLQNQDELLAANPDYLKISVSGFTQKHHGITHAGGNIEVVKRNMISLAEAKQRVRSKTRIEVDFHQYLTNLDDLPLMTEFARSLGFTLISGWAAFFPLEKTWTYAEPDKALAEVTNTDREILDRVAIPIADVLKMAAKTPVKSCSLQDDNVVLDVEGNVYLCCAVAMDSKRNRLAPYLSVSWETLRRLKQSHDLCDRCMAAGLPPVLESSYGLPHIETLANERYAEFTHSSRRT